MEKFPDWAKPLLENKDGRVCHGLNLTLPLNPNLIPSRLPLLLWDIVLAQNQIKRALEELSFVHYARFIPSWDARALMVTTEFDGPIEPYVLDFVIALGDVFDMLLSYVDTHPEPPPRVRDDPEGFLQWVLRWNRVPYFPPAHRIHTLHEISLTGKVVQRKTYVRDPDTTAFPESFDYPLYSAYPDKTVTDITGPRAQVPLPALDRHAAEVDAADVQGNILRGYRASHARYLFFTVTDPVAARNWLATGLVEPTTPWLGVANASLWPKGTAPAVLTQVAFTYEGMKKLLAAGRLRELDDFPLAFQQGAASRAEGNFDRGTSAPVHWLFGQPTGDQDHVVLFLYLTDVTSGTVVFDAAVTALESGATQGLKHLRTMKGDSAGGYEPFGFRDDVSGPRISGQCPAAEPSFQPAASPGEFLIHKDYLSMYGGSSLGRMPQRLAGNGSFGVLRLMEQDVQRFKACTDSEAARLGLNANLLRAKLVGRWPNGVPLAAPDNSTHVDPLDAFDYAPSWEFPKVSNDHVGLHCPVGAHIRRANPRSSRVAGQPHARRLLRRGMSATWTEGGQAKAGLMGLFMGANIEQQFEFIQREWLQGDLAASGVRDTSDPIAAIRSEPTDFSLLQPNPAHKDLPPRVLTVKVDPLIRTRGCLYLFFPGLAALKGLSVSTVADSVTEANIDEAGAGRDARGPQSQTAAADPAWLIALPVLSMPDLSADEDVRKWVTQDELHALLPTEEVEVLQTVVFRRLDPRFRDLLYSLSPRFKEAQPTKVIDQGGIDLSSRVFLGQPFDELKKLRIAGKRIVWVKEQQAYWVLQHDDCMDLLCRNEAFVQTQTDNPFRGVVTLDLPQHKVVRDALDAAFRVALAILTPKIPSIVEAASGGLLAQKQLMQFDFMKSFAHPVARGVIWALVGIKNTKERQHCDTLTHTMMLNYGRKGKEEAIESAIFGDAGLKLAARLGIPLVDAIRQSFLKKSDYEGTLIGELAARVKVVLPDPKRTLGYTETLITLVQTVVASQSPHLLLSSTALHLLQHDPRPGKALTPWAELASMTGDKVAFDTALTLALHETRRCEPPLSLIERYAKGEQAICGITVRDGCPVFAMVASGNRDAKVFPQDGEDFHFDRPNAASHLSLGRGIHQCAGDAVQDALVKAALTLIIEAMPDLRLANPSAVPPWHPTISFRLLQGLSVARC